MNKKNASPFFTIIMPNYKTEAFLEEALDSVLNQTFTDYECILVNDGSPGVDIELFTNNPDSNFNNTITPSKKIKRVNQCKYILIN
ncbi:glycosyltransferase family 2 protein [Candidatus Gracilibacteria bacterium]|nr:glycosyltransferase family 2 protein [Candidatus Gracilibacteria bacterium]